MIIYVYTDVEIYTYTYTYICNQEQDIFVASTL